MFKRLHFSQRAISSVISYVMIVGLVVGGMGMAYLWGRPLVYGMRDSNMIQQVVNDMETLAGNSLDVIHEGVDSQRTTMFKFDRGLVVVLPKGTYGNILFTFSHTAIGGLAPDQNVGVGAVEFQLRDTYTTLVETNGTMYFRGGREIAVTSDSTGSQSVLRVALQKIGEYYVNVRLDLRAYIYSYYDSSDNLHIHIYVYQITIPSTGASGRGPGPVYVTVRNCGSNCTNIYSGTPGSGDVVITAKFNELEAETPVSKSVSSSKSVSIDLYTVILEVSMR